MAMHEALTAAAKPNAPSPAARLVRLAVRALIASLLAWPWADAAVAAAPAVSLPTEPEMFQPAQPDTAAGPFGFLAAIDRSNYLLGDMWGLRTFLSRYGMSLALQETSEVLGNVSGGSRQGFAYDGLTQATLQLDTERAFRWHGGTFNASALQIHGRNLSAENLLTLQTASGIEADRALRLWELWYQQKFFEEDRLDAKLGQQSLDQEFMATQNGAFFVNTMFGWPMLPSADLPGGGPAYPLSALGARLRARPTDSVTLLAGVFSGSPVGNDTGDPQKQNPSGTSFPWNGALVIAELQYAYPALGAMIEADKAEPLARVYKLGLWYDNKRFADQQFDNTGLSLANPASSGIPRTHRGNYAIYAVLDQIVWQDPEELDRTVSVFLRPMGTPLADRNLIDFSLNAGLTIHEPFLHRDSDTFGIGMGYAHVSARAAAHDRDTALFTGTFTPIRSGETFIELTYQYQVKPWWQLQPDFQYVFNPGAGIANPNAPTKRVENEAVLGLRTTILF
jgi:porin